MTIQVNLVLNPSDREGKIHLHWCYLPLTYQHNHFLITDLDFTYFYTITFLNHTLFLELGLELPSRNLEEGIIVAWHVRPA